MKTISIVLIAALVLLVACSNSGPTGDVVLDDGDTKLTSDGSGKVVMENDEAKVTVEGDDEDAKITIESDDGDQVIEAKSGTDSWCSEGAEWSSSGSEGDAQMVIVGIVDSGKYKDYCHVTYDFDSAGGQGNMDMYFNEEGNGYQVMEVNGQKFESEWSE
ncbi:MAG: hypothetical protein KKG59_06505 [Nanoarchaeota archaeon]|nr:hypothetical protein [Nanoarchaeota archaeon]